MVERIEKPCVDCGKPVPLKPPNNDALTARMVAALGVMCNDCSRKEAAAEMEVKAEMDRRHHEARIQQSGLPSKLLGVRFDQLERTPTNDEALKAGESWGRGQIRGLVITGPVGVGKTWTAAAAANLFLERRGLRWFSVVRLLAQARAGFKDRNREEVNKVLLDPRLALVMDDIDKVNPTDFARDILFQAIDERVNNDTPLLVTTNMRYPELEQTYGEPIASRLAGYCKAVRIDGTDRRKEHLNE